MKNDAAPGAEGFRWMARQSTSMSMGGNLTGLIAIGAENGEIRRRDSVHAPALPC